MVLVPDTEILKLTAIKIGLLSVDKEISVNYPDRIVNGSGEVGGERGG
jgi:hypothetical protein